MQNKKYKIQVDDWDIPTNPQAVYSDDWKGWSQFLQSCRQSRQKAIAGHKSLRDLVLLAERLRRDHGHIPNPNWLKRRGYGKLVTAMREYPGAFEHLYRRRT